ncbi:MAG: hypothetical protein ACKVUT_07440 [Gaiella sp.]
MGRTRWTAAVAGVAATLALAAGTATAAERPGGERGAQERPARDRPVDRASKCDRLDHAIEALERHAAHLRAKIAKLEARLASGELSPEQAARARALLEGLKSRLGKVLDTISRLQEAQAEKCDRGAPEATPAQA